MLIEFFLFEISSTVGVICLVLSWVGSYFSNRHTYPAKRLDLN